MAIISLENIRFHGQIGCYDEEKIVGNHYEVNIQLKIAPSFDGREDDLGNTVNYEEVYVIVKQYAKKKANLLEFIAHQMADDILSQCKGVEGIKLKLSKLNPPLGGDIGRVSYELSQDFDEKT